MKTNYDNLDTVIYLILINLIVSVIYLLVRIIKKDYERGIMMFLFIILIPIIAPLYLFVSYVIYRIYFKHRKSDLSIEELSLRKDKIEVIQRDDFKIASNKVPLEEALIISDKKDTRRLMLNILKEERGDYINSIYKATGNIDDEVAHYAASAITDIMDKFKEREKELKAQYEKDKTDKVVGETYWLYLSDFLITNILSSVEQMRFLKILEDLTLDLEKHAPESVRAELYYRLVVICIELKLMSQAEFWVNKALENRKNELESYKAALKYYYTINCMDKFKSLLESLKSSTVRLDRETLELIRFYNN